MKDTVISKGQQYQTCVYKHAVKAERNKVIEKCWLWDTTIGIMPATP